MTHPLRYAVGVQLLAALIVYCVAIFVPESGRYPLMLFFAQGGFAALLSWWVRMPRWWIWIGGLFVPLAYMVQGLGLPSWVWLVCFLLLLAIFWRTDSSRVPLYMSNGATVSVLSTLLTAKACRVIDLGCGDGSLLRQLARSRPDCSFVGYEHAPLTWAWAKLLGRQLSNLDIRLGSFWAHPLVSYDLIYAFLSPSPMADLWVKAKAEMRSDAVLVSNSFSVPDVRAGAQISVGDRRESILYCYALGELPKRLRENH